MAVGALLLRAFEADLKSSASRCTEPSARSDILHRLCGLSADLTRLCSAFVLAG